MPAQGVPGSEGRARRPVVCAPSGARLKKNARGAVTRRPRRTRLGTVGRPGRATSFRSSFPGRPLDPRTNPLENGRNDIVQRQRGGIDHFRVVGRNRRSDRSLAIAAIPLLHVPKKTRKNNRFPFFLQLLIPSLPVPRRWLRGTP